MRAGHLGQWLAIDARERRVGPLFDLDDLGHRQTGLVDAIHAAGAEHVAFLHVGIAGHEAQLHAAAMNHHRIAIRDTASAGAHVAHGDGLVAIDQQGDFAGERKHAGDLAQHAGRIDHGRARDHTGDLPAVDDHAAGIGVGGVVHHLGGHARGLDAIAQLEELAQLGVFLHQQVDLIGLLRHVGHLALRLVAALLGFFQRLEVARAVTRQLDGFEHHPLNRHQHRANGRANRLRDVKTRIRHHQKQRQSAVEGQASKGRWPLFEEGGSLSVERA